MPRKQSEDYGQIEILKITRDALKHLPDLEGKSYQEVLEILIDHYKKTKDREKK